MNMSITKDFKLLRGSYEKVFLPAYRIILVVNYLFV